MGFGVYHGDMNKSMTVQRASRDQPLGLFQEIADDAFEKGLIPLAPHFLHSREDSPSHPKEIFKSEMKDASTSASSELLPDERLEVDKTMDVDRARRYDLKAAEPDRQAVLDNISYEQACSYSQFISKSLPERKTGTSALPFKPTPTQIKSVAWMYRMRHEKEISGAMLVPGTGCGKTAASLAVLETESKRITEENISPYKPHLVVYIEDQRGRQHSAINVQRLVEMFTCLVGLSVASIRQDGPGEDHTTILATFNDPKSSKFDVLVSTVRIIGTSHNVHLACHVMILPDGARGTGYTIQAVGRLHRLGQRHRQYVYQISTQNSHDRFLEGRNAHKYHATIAASGHPGLDRAVQDALPKREFTWADASNNSEVPMLRRSTLDETIRKI
ncbi:uncharacterized protein J3D65DRAFT_663828 [Phyllosticta citribraziliensis]|uniref:Helicase C-terminal domain-containing protein n=1 Tax=Phyllosticta citribraziliensis TaxID=989973 RepID=A0ABR1M9P6_9PEZI